MAELAKKHKDQLPRIKNNVQSWLEKNTKNRTRYWESKYFVYKSSMSDQDTNVALEKDRPMLESNILKPYLSRQVGEVSKQLPDPLIMPKMGNPEFIQQADIIEGHARHIFSKAKNIQSDSFKDAAAGGYYVFQVVVDRLRDDKVDKGIFIRKVYDSTMCGFDNLAQESHKADGRYAWSRAPKIKEEVEEQYNIKLKDSDFYGDDKTWFYETDDNQKVVMLCNYFEKKTVYRNIVLISSPLHPDAQTSMWKEDYEDLINKGISEGKSEAELPQIVSEETVTTHKIVNYILTGSRVLEYKETDYKYFPLIMCVGEEEKVSENEIMTIPLLYNAMDIQKARNVSFQSMFNAIENKDQTNTYVPKQGLPTSEDEILAWDDFQKKYKVRTYKHVDANGNPIPPPFKLSPDTIDQSEMSFYNSTAESIQLALGMYDTQEGQQSANLSGKAIQNGSIQSNNATMPYITNYLEAWTQALRVVVDLIPKYYTTLRSIPYIDRQGKSSYILINNSLSDTPNKIEYSEDDMEVDVKMDLSFEMQKQVAFDNIQKLMGESEDFKAFFGGPGSHFILDNMTFRDVVKVKEEFQKFQQQQQSNKAQMMQMQMATNPVVAQTKIAQMDHESKEKDRIVSLIEKMIDAKMEKLKLNIDATTAQAKIIESKDKVTIASMGQIAENKRSEADLAIAFDKHAYSKIESDREHALKVRDSNRDHMLDMVGMIGDMKNEKENQKANEEGQMLNGD